MKKIILLFVLLNFAFTQSDEDEIKQVIQGAFDVILSDLEMERLPEFFTDDFLLLEVGHIWNNDTIYRILGNYKNTPNRPKRTNRFEYVKIDINQDRAWVAYHNYAKLNYSDGRVANVKWLESAVLVKRKSGWIIEMLHSTKIYDDRK